MENYQDLKREKDSKIVETQNSGSLICSDGALGNVTKEFKRWIVTLGIIYNVGVMQ